MIGSLKIARSSLLSAHTPFTTPDPSLHRHLAKKNHELHVCGESEVNVPGQTNKTDNMTYVPVQLVTEYMYS